jgi:sugar lactone lactonase YvrE
MHNIKTLITGFLAASVPFVSSTPDAASVRTIYEYPEGTWLENIAQMRNGSLLVSVIGTADIHMVNPYTSPATSTHIARIPSSNAALGIAELSPNVFAIAAGNLHLDTNTPIDKSFSIWRLDLRHSPPIATKLADTPAVNMTNGLAALNANTLLLADSWAGNIASLDVNSGKTTVLLSHPTLASNFSAPGLPAGANGIRLRGSYLYYTNTVASLVGRVKIDKRTGKAVRPFEVLAQSADIGTPDDIAVADDGSVLVARPLDDAVERVRSAGRIETVVQGEEVKGATALVFGRTKRDVGTLYASSSQGRIFAIEL